MCLKAGAGNAGKLAKVESSIASGLLLNPSPALGGLSKDTTPSPRARALPHRNCFITELQAVKVTVVVVFSPVLQCNYVSPTAAAAVTCSE